MARSMGFHFEVFIDIGKHEVLMTEERYLEEATRNLEALLADEYSHVPTASFRVVPVSYGSTPYVLAAAG